MSEPAVNQQNLSGEPVDPKTYRKKYEELLKREGVPFWPDAAWRDVIFSTVVCLTILVLAIVVGPPELNKPPDPTEINAVPRPDWYFFWFFSLMALLPHGSEKYLLWIIPAALVLVTRAAGASLRDAVRLGSPDLPMPARQFRPRSLHQSRTATQAASCSQ